MNQTSATLEKDVDEMGLGWIDTRRHLSLCHRPELLKPPYIWNASTSTALRYRTGVTTDRYVLILGEVIGVHIQNDLITKDGLIDVARMRPVGRLGYNDYTEVSGDSCFTMIRPP